MLMHQCTPNIHIYFRIVDSVIFNVYFIQCEYNLHYLNIEQLSYDHCQQWFELAILSTSLVKS